MAIKNTAIKVTLLFLLAIFIASQAVNAQPAKKLSPVQWQQLKNDKDLTYKNDVENIKPPEVSKPNALANALTAILSIFSGGLGTVILWLLVIGLIVYIIYSIVLSKDSFLFSRKSKALNTADEQEQTEDDLYGTNWEAMLQKAISNNDTRLSVRYCYMWLLQLLQDGQLIQYRTDKTNHEYYIELQESTYRQPFRQLSRQYEYAWYGNYPLSSDAFNEYLTLFNNLRNHIGK